MATAPTECALCCRTVPSTTAHHLVPKSRGGRETEPLCLDCHSMVHTLFDNKRLERELCSIAALRAEPAMARYLKWVASRPGATRFRPRSSRRRRR